MSAELETDKTVNCIVNLLAFIASVTNDCKSRLCTVCVRVCMILETYLYLIYIHIKSRTAADICEWIDTRTRPVVIRVGNSVGGVLLLLFVILVWPREL